MNELMLLFDIVPYEVHALHPTMQKCLDFEKAGHSINDVIIAETANIRKFILQLGEEMEV